MFPMWLYEFNLVFPPYTCVGQCVESRMEGNAGNTVITAVLITTGRTPGSDGRRTWRGTGFWRYSLQRRSPGGTYVPTRISALDLRRPWFNSLRSQRKGGTVMLISRTVADWFVWLGNMKWKWTLVSFVLYGWLSSSINVGKGIGCSGGNYRVFWLEWRK